MINFKRIHFWKLNPALLALIFSVIAEVLFFGVLLVFRKFTQFGDPLNFISWFGFLFHVLPDVYLPHDWSSDFLAIPAWLFQWWIIFFPGIIFTRYVLKKESLQALRSVIFILSTAFITALIFLIHSQYWQGSNWKNTVTSLADDQGCNEAASDFESGKLKLLIISGECDEDKYSGTNDGPFAIWVAQYYPDLPWPDRFSMEERVRYYNLTMRNKYERSLTHTNNANLSH
ncbi:MAG TPA: hypothetical protein VGN23_10185 [Verrucomicrobiae bacterium]